MKEASARDWVNEALRKALAERASDIHIEPQRAGQRSVRLRIDGLLKAADLGPLLPADSLIARLKILCELDITEIHHPQDGHFEIFDQGQQPIDVRVSFMPTIYGETVVMRLLNQQEFLMDLPQLGFDKGQLEVLESIIKRPNGIIFVSGPSGSGKTTVLYALLRRLQSPTRSILTLEDPVEYQIDGIRQTQAGGESDLTFAAGLRSFLRQDPDVIMVGEIRDEETAEIASRAALTGHLVLSTLHANDGVGVIVRLLDMGVGRATIASSLAAVISRRLVRLVCEQCKESYSPPAGLLKRLGLDPGVVTHLTRGKGCPACGQSGFKGRIGIHEIIHFDSAVRALILDENSYTALVQKIRKQGVKSLRQDGLEKALRGLTTVEEVVRVTEDDEFTYSRPRADLRA